MYQFIILLHCLFFSKKNYLPIQTSKSSCSFSSSLNLLFSSSNCFCKAFNLKDWSLGGGDNLGWFSNSDIRCFNKAFSSCVAINSSCAVFNSRLSDSSFVFYDTCISSLFFFFLVRKEIISYQCL